MFQLWTVTDHIEAGKNLGLSGSDVRKFVQELQERDTEEQRLEREAQSERLELEQNVQECEAEQTAREFETRKRSSRARG